MSRRPTKPRPAPAPLPEEAPPPRTRLSIGAVIGRSFAIWARSIVPFTVLSAVVHIPWIAWQWLRPRAPGLEPPYAVDRILTWTLGELFSLLTSGLVAFSVVRTLRGKATGALLGIRAGLSRLPKAVGAGLVAGAYSMVPALAAGFMRDIGPLAVLPASALSLFGTMAYCQAWVAVPAAVAEEVGPLRAMRRSLALTRGSRWRIFLVFVLMVGAPVIAAVIVEASQRRGLPAGAATPSLLLTLLSVLLVTPLAGVASAVTYHDLRVMKEGLTSEEIAAVFD